LIYHRDLFLKNYYTLLDVAEMYGWNMVGMIHYRLGFQLV